MNAKSSPVWRWLPRGLAIAFALFLGMFALDVWGMEGTFWQKLGGFLIHLAPTFAVLLLALIGWRWPLVGGTLFIALAAVFAVFFNLTTEWQVFALIGLPPIIIGLLFLWDGWRGRHELQLGL